MQSALFDLHTAYALMSKTLLESPDPEMGYQSASLALKTRIAQVGTELCRTATHDGLTKPVSLELQRVFGEEFLSKPYSLLALENGRLLVSDVKRKAVFSCSFQGGDVTVLPLDLESPTGLFADGAGGVYVCDFRGRLVRTTPDGGSPRVFDLARVLPESMHRFTRPLSGAAYGGRLALVLTGEAALFRTAAFFSMDGDRLRFEEALAPQAEYLYALAAASGRLFVVNNNPAMLFSRRDDRGVFRHHPEFLFPDSIYAVLGVGKDLCLAGGKFLARYSIDGGLQYLVDVPERFGLGPMRILAMAASEKRRRLFLADSMASRILEVRYD